MTRTDCPAHEPMIAAPHGAQAEPAFPTRALAVALALLLPLIYFACLRGQFLWDDNAHVTKESLRSLEGLRRIWFELGATQQYYPLLHSAFWFEHQLWGDATLGYHLVNLVLHGTGAIFFGLALHRLGVRAAWFATLVFAVHPVHVESVAWISEQKNTLSTVFYLGAALAYLRFDATRQRRAYLIGLGFFVLALLTKTVTATLPAALLVVAWWRRGRISWRSDVQPLLPWFVAGVVAGIFTAWVERTLIGAEGSEYALSLGERFIVAGRVVWFYLGKLIWPADLSFIYPRWTLVPSRVDAWLPLIGVLALLALLWRWRTQTRGPLAAALFYGGTLVPVLGFLNVYPFRYSFVADHFQYVASMGMIALFAAGFDRVMGRWPSARLPAALAVVAALALVARQQAQIYRDPETLWRDTIAHNPEGPMPWLNLGAHRVNEGRVAEAVPALERARALKPDYAEVYINLGIVEMLSHRFDAAVPLLRRALELRPQSVEAHDNLGLALRKLKQVEEAIAHHREALRLQSDYHVAQNNLGCALLDAGQPAEALPYFELVLQRTPDDPDIHHNRGNALRMLGRLPEAIASYERALQLNPNLNETREELGMALVAAGRGSDAIPQLERALQAKPGNASVRNQLGLALAQMGRLGDALAHFDAALRLTPDDAAAELNRGIALTGLDRWAEARASFSRVIALDPGSFDGHRNLAIALANTGSLDESVNHFQAALRLVPDSAETHQAVSQVLQLLGRSAEAEQHRARAAALSPGPR